MINLTEEQLENIGINALGARKKFVKLFSQISQNFAAE